jgi:hypothetical protein
MRAMDRAAEHGGQPAASPLGRPAAEFRVCHVKAWPNRRGAGVDRSDARAAVEAAGATDCGMTKPSASCRRVRAFASALV